jgi:hypothetical protein
MMILGMPEAYFLILAGLLVFLAAYVFHWLLMIIALVLVAVGLYLVFTGGALPL